MSQHVATQDDTERSDKIRLQLEQLRKEKTRLKAVYKSRSSLLRYMRDIEPDIREVLGVQVYHTKVLLYKGIIVKGIIHTKVLLNKGIIRN